MDRKANCDLVSVATLPLVSGRWPVCLPRVTAKSTLHRRFDGASWLGRAVTGLITLAVIVVLFQGLVVVDASSFANGGNISVRAGEAFTDEAEVIVTSHGIRKIGSTTTAVGDAAPGVEANSDMPALNNALAKNHYAYAFQVKEAAPGSWGADEKFKIEVYGGGATATSLLATLYVQQREVDDAYVEGISATIDVGSSRSIPDSFDIVVTRQ